MNQLVVPGTIWNSVRAHLLQDRNEHFAFFFAGVARSKMGISFLARDIMLIRDEQLVSGDGWLQINLHTLLDVINAAISKKLALVEAHSHPFSRHGTTFSPIDYAGFKEFVPYVLDSIPWAPYGAIVLGDKSVDGLFWKSDRNPQLLDEIRIIGDSILRVQTTSDSKRLGSKGSVDARSYDDMMSRQVLAFGMEGQDLIRATRVAIVGCGGIGSHIAQQLTYLGVRNFVLVDFDKIEHTNLNRLVGAEPSDIGKFKVDVIEKMIRKVAGREDIRIEKYRKDLREGRVLDTLKDVDVISGCVDKDGPRLILNELSKAYMIPYLDCATQITASEGKIAAAGGRVAAVLPEGPCLLCSKDIDIKAAYDDLAPPEEFEVKKHQGYITGADVPDPSVVSLNGTVASIAVTEFLALVTRFRRVRQYTCYDMLELKSNMVARQVSRDPKCFTCSIMGLGDRAGIERYSTTGKQNDIRKVVFETKGGSSELEVVQARVPTACNKHVLSPSQIQNLAGYIGG